MLQEAARKDIERAFGILQARWHILDRPCRLWLLHDIRQVMYACIILHNMIVEERDCEDPVVQEYESATKVIPNNRDPQLRQSLASFLANNRDLTNSEVHHQLMSDLKIANWVARGTRGS